MPATYMLRKYLVSREYTNRPEAVVAQVTDIDASKRAEADMKARFPKVSPENFEAANQYYKERLRNWREVLLG